MTKQAAVAKQEAQPVAATGTPALALTKAQQKVVDGLPTVSARIRYLDGQKFARADITKLIPNAKGGKLIYQHVRGVLEAKAPKSSS